MVAWERGPPRDIGTAGCERDGMKPTESAAPVSRLQGFAGLTSQVRRRRRGGRRRAARYRLLPDGPRRTRALPRRHRRLVARRAHRHRRRPPGRPRPRPLVGRHRFRRRPHPRRPAALRLGGRRTGQPRRRRARRRRPAVTAGGRGCCTARSTSSASAPPPSSWPPSATSPRVETPWQPSHWGIDAVPEVLLAAGAYLARHPAPALVRHGLAQRRAADRRPHRTAAPGARRASPCSASPR